MNTTQGTITEHKIDATDKKLGRLSTEVAVLLMGKNRTDFAKNKVAPVKVYIENAAKLDVGDKKKTEKIYLSYSGYPGGQKKETARQVIEKKGYGELIRRAVKGMLPKNKLQTPTMKNLIIEE